MIGKGSSKEREREGRERRVRKGIRRKIECEEGGKRNKTR